MPEDPPAPPTPPESPDPERGWFARVRRSRLLAGVVWSAEQAGKLAILVTIVNYFLEAPDRLKSKEFQAWQLVNSAKTGDGGRKLALHDLVQEDVDLSGLNLDGANLVGADLRGGNLNQVSFAHAVLDTTDFSCRPRRRLLLLIDAACQATNLGRSVFTAPMLLTSFRGARLDAAAFSTPGAPGTVPRDGISFVNFSEANAFAAEFHDLGIWDANFSGASLEQTRFVRVQFARTSFDRADLRHRQAPGRRTAFDDLVQRDDLRGRRSHGSDVRRRSRRAPCRRGAGEHAALSVRRLVRTAVAAADRGRPEGGAPVQDGRQRLAQRQGLRRRQARRPASLNAPHQTQWPGIQSPRPSQRPGSKRW